MPPAGMGLWRAAAGSPLIAFLHGVWQVAPEQELLISGDGEAGMPVSNRLSNGPGEK